MGSPMVESLIQKSITTILVRPEHAENIGLAARCMKNTGFSMLRIVGSKPIQEKAFITAVHAQDILKEARVFSSIDRAVEDLDFLLAATAKKRKNFSVIPLDEAVRRLSDFPAGTRFGFLFGNERTGLTSKELRASNIRFRIPQFTRQPSYNLASAVLLTLYAVFNSARQEKRPHPVEKPLSRKEQDICIRLILDLLERKRFFHAANRNHMTERIFDLFGRLALTEKDRDLLLAVFSKGIGGNAGRPFLHPSHPPTQRKGGETEGKTSHDSSS